ncbi:MAG: hypothetical protein WBA43_14235 [Elainellaceae cyanobacterium]
MCEDSLRISIDKLKKKENIKLYEHEKDIPLGICSASELVRLGLVPTREPHAYLQRGSYAIPLYKRNNAIDKSIFLQVAISTRDLEIRMLWQRSIFFVGFMLAAATAAVSIISSLGHSQTLQQQNICHLYQVLLSVSLFIGMASSIGWVLVNIASKYWTENWEAKIFQHPDIKTLFQPLQIRKTLFQPLQIGKEILGIPPQRISVSKLTIAYSLLATIFWITAFGFSLKWLGCSNYGATFYAIISPIFVCQIFRSFSTSED